VSELCGEFGCRCCVNALTDGVLKNEEITRLKARNEKLERVREKAGYLPENPVNADRDILDCIVVEIIQAIKDCEVGD